jgi:argininosuccinate lyase
LNPSIRPPATKDVNDVFRGGPRAVGFLGQINKASIVMLAGAGVVAPDDARRIAAGVRTLALEDASAPQQPSADYLDYEKRLEARVGAQASLIHAGRSRQDIASTLSRMNLRDDLLLVYASLARARIAAVKLAAGHRETIIPAYTHGVQAQPTTLAHYLLALASGLARSLGRLEDIYPRLNLSPLGAGALSTSSFPVDRERLAQLLGFDGIIDNAYDANHLAPVDSGLEFASAIAIGAIQAGQFAQDFHIQYAAPRPWMLLAGGDLVGISSLMPQKRNPAALEQLRAQSSLLLAEMQGPFLLAHNTRTGYFDYRAYDPLPSTKAVLVFDLLARVLGGIVVDAQQARAEVDADYSTSTEIADVLMQDASVPFRSGHHFASAIADYGRSRRLSLREVPYAAAAELWRAQEGSALPLTEAQYAGAIDPARMIARRRGRGGPQPAEIERQLAEARAFDAASLAWLDARREAQKHADAALDGHLARLAGL